MKKIIKSYRRLSMGKKYAIIMPIVSLALGGAGFGLYEYIKESAAIDPYLQDISENSSVAQYDIGPLGVQKGFQSSLKSASQNLVQKTPYNEVTKEFYCYIEDASSSKDSSFSYEYDKTNDQINGIDAKEFISNTIISDRKPLFMSCYAQTKFVNEYVELIEPKEWVNFVDWFLDNVSYGPEIYNLEDFTLARGFVENSPGVITLGAFSDPNKEDSSIEFYPDGYFGVLPISTPYTGFDSSLTFEYEDAVGRKTFTREEIDGENGLSAIFSNIAEEYGYVTITNNDGTTREVPRFKPSVVKKVGENADGEEVFTIYLERFAGLLDRLRERYPHLWTDKEELYEFDWDKANGFKFAKKNNVPGLSSSNSLPLALVIKELVPDYDFTTLFLKYTGMHEYYHHTTLAASKNLANEPYALVGEINDFSGASNDKLFSMESLNDYFNARNPLTQVYRKQDGHVGFIVNGKKETTEDIYGRKTKEVYDPKTGTFSLSSTDKDDKTGRAYRNWSDLKKLSNEERVSVFLRNAFDTVNATLSPSIPLSDLEVLDENGNFVTSDSVNFDGVSLEQKHAAQGFTGEIEGDVSRVDKPSYGTPGLFEVLSDSDYSKTDTTKKYLEDWYYQKIIDGAIPATGANIDEALRQFSMLNAQNNVQTFGDVSKAMRGFIYPVYNTDGTLKERYYVKKLLSFNNPSFTSVVMNLGNTIQFDGSFRGLAAAGRDLSGGWASFFNVQRVNFGGSIGELFVSTLGPSNSTALFNKTSISANGFPFTGAPATLSDGTIVFLNASQALDFMSKTPFIYKDGETAPSLSNANPDVIDITKLRTQLNSLNTEQEKADYLRFLEGLFSYVEKDVKISDDNGSTLNDSFDFLDNQELRKSKAEEMKKVFNKYPVWESQLFYHDRVNVPNLGSFRDTNQASAADFISGVNQPVFIPKKLAFSQETESLEEIQESNYVDGIAGLFANYMLTYEEVLVRDYLMITYIPDNEENVNPTGTKITEATSAYNYYISPDLYKILFEDKTTGEGDDRKLIEEKLLLNTDRVLTIAEEEYKRAYGELIDSITDSEYVKIRTEIDKYSDEGKFAAEVRDALAGDFNTRIDSLRRIINKYPNVEETKELSAIIDQYNAIKKYIDFTKLTLESDSTNSNLVNVLEAERNKLEDTYSVSKDTNTMFENTRKGYAFVDEFNKLLDSMKSFEELRADALSLITRTTADIASINIMKEEFKKGDENLIERLKAAVTKAAETKYLVQKLNSYLSDANLAQTIHRNLSQLLVTNLSLKINEGLISVIKELRPTLPLPSITRFVQEVRSKTIEQIDIFKDAFKTNIFAEVTSGNDSTIPTWLDNRGRFDVDGIRSRNGYFVDRWSRKQLGWELYNEDKTSKDHGATAYWEYLLKTNLVGQSWISGVKRKDDTDRVHFYGYVPNNLKDSIKKMRFTWEDDNGKTVTSSIDINMLQDDTLYYNVKDIDRASRHTIGDEGFTPWVTNSIVVGQYADAVLPASDQPYTIEILDADGNVVEIPMKKDEIYISENGKLRESAPSLLHIKDGKATYTVKPKFGS